MSAVGDLLRPGDPVQLGSYQLLRRLGEGGMGSVYLARGKDGTLVAIKLIRQDLSCDPGFRKRFRGEVARAKQVPAFCTAEVLDADPDHDPPYLVVEYVDGPSLAAVVAERGPLSRANLHGLAIGVATSLTAIHGAGVIHRDLKPANVLLALGSPKVIDFGIARALEGTTATDTGAGQVIGTISYMAPERLDPSRGALTAAADVFAWGAVVAFAGTGRPPFGNGTIETAARILTQPPDLLGLTESLHGLVQRALAKDPADRPTARELLDHLVSSPTGNLIEAASKQAVVSVPAPLPDTTRIEPLPAFELSPPTRQRKWAIPTLATGMVLLTAVVVANLTGLLAPLGGQAMTPGPSASASTSDSPSSVPSVLPSTSPSPSLSLSPSPIASPSPTQRLQLRLKESLAAQGVHFMNVENTASDIQVSCRLDGALLVTKQVPGTFRCPGFPDPLTDFRASVDVSLRSGSPCAGMWFRFGGTSLRGYLLSLCEDKFVLYLHDGNQQPIIRSIAVPKSKSFRAGVEVNGTLIRIFHNGKLQQEFTDDKCASGKVSLGIAIPYDTTAAAPYQITFRNLEIHDILQPS